MTREVGNFLFTSKKNETLKGENNLTRGIPHVHCTVKWDQGGKREKERERRRGKKRGVWKSQGFSNWKYVDSSGKFVKNVDSQADPYTFELNKSYGNSENLHFKWFWCRCSRDHTLRNTDEMNPIWQKLDYTSETHFLIIPLTQITFKVSINVLFFTWGEKSKMIGKL